MEILIGLLIGLIAGILAGYFLGKKQGTLPLSSLLSEKERELEMQRHLHEEREREHERALEMQKHLYEEKEREQARELEMQKHFHEEQIASLKSHQREQMEMMTSRFEETIAKMREEVTNVTRQMLEQREREFSANSEKQFNQLMEPLNRSISEMRLTVQDNTQKHTEFSGQLKASVENVLRQSEAARLSADRLATALSGSNKTQGNWGETVLKELLEHSGLKEGIHFDTQTFLEDETGKKIIGSDGTKLQPDVIVHIDKDHSVVIDSKVSLTDFFRYSEAEDDVTRSESLKAHIMSLKQQVKRLAAKDYSKYLRNSTGYVIMFVPVSQALYVATDADHALWRDAMEQGVYIADEQTLYAALKIIALNWKQQDQAENHEQVFKLANELLDRVGAFMEKFSDIGTALNKAQDSYEQGKKKLTEGGQSIPTTCKKLVQLGARYEKKKGLLAQELDK